MSELKLFVWGRFDPIWGGGVKIAIAETEEEARELVIKEHGWDASDWGTLQILPIAKCAFSVSSED